MRDVFRQLSNLELAEIDIRLEHLNTLNASIEDVRRAFFEVQSRAHHTTKEFLESVLQSGRYELKKKGRQVVREVLMGDGENVVVYSWNNLQEHKQRARFHLHTPDGANDANTMNSQLKEFEEKDKIAVENLSTAENLILLEDPVYLKPIYRRGEWDVVVEVNLASSVSELEQQRDATLHELRNWQQAKEAFATSSALSSLWSLTQLRTIFSILLAYNGLEEEEKEEAQFRITSIVSHVASSSLLGRMVRQHIVCFII